MKYRQFFSFLLAVAFCGLVGCPSTVPPHERDEGDVGKVSELVQLFSDNARETDSFETCFPAGKAPDDKIRLRYMKLYQTLTMEPLEPEVTGDQATITIEVLDPDDPATVIETVTWTASKLGDEWKLMDAPFPAAAPK